jgi:hypothetical protein
MSPPYSETKCEIVDDGNCSPAIIRSTLYSVPVTTELLNQSSV